MRCSGTLFLSRYGFELFDTPIKEGHFGDARPPANAEVRKGIIVSRPKRRRSPRRALKRRLTISGRLRGRVNFTRDA
ncbi:MAG TPA: hypothetical protein VJW76_04495 [Verrucomicrobiae bacterium]|nr:hypothetical protein [Verrucomicrobiae bacterium]